MVPVSMILGFIAEVIVATVDFESGNKVRIFAQL